MRVELPLDRTGDELRRHRVHALAERAGGPSRASVCAGAVREPGEEAQDDSGDRPTEEEPGGSGDRSVRRDLLPTILTRPGLASTGFGGLDFGIPPYVGALSSVG